MRGIRLAADLVLPVDAATGTFGILATKGAGKSNAAVVMAERMHDAGVPWVAVDPKGDWHGVRSSADGTGPGLPVVVFGGRHGDVDLEPTAGVLIADLVLKHRLTCVLDVSQFTKADTTRFLLAFGRHLFKHADDDGAEPLHLFLEEAHEYLPQVVKGDQAELVNVWQRIVKQGRFKGLGCTLISQRSSVLNKDVLELIDTLIVLRTIGPRSRQSIKDWVQDQDVDPQLLQSLPGLGDGEAWVWSPGALRILQRIQFDRRRTFDSGATPKVGERRRTPATVADVDLAAIKEAMAETIERAKADDPRELRRRIAQLEKDLAAERAKPAPLPERVEIVPGELIAVVNQARRMLLESADQLTATSAEIGKAEDRAHARNALADDREDVPRARQASRGPDPVERPEAAQRPDPAPRREPSRPAVQRTAPAEGVTGPQQKILDALAWLATVGIEPATRLQAAMVAGYHPRTKGFTNALGAMRTDGLISYPTPGTICLTSAGAAAALPPPRPLTDADLQQMVYAQVGPARSRILQQLVAAYPESLSRSQLADALGYHERTKGFTNGLGSLRSLGLLDYPQAGHVVASELLFAGGVR